MAKLLIKEIFHYRLRFTLFKVVGGVEAYQADDQ